VILKNVNVTEICAAHILIKLTYISKVPVNWQGNLKYGFRKQLLMALGLIH